MTRSQPNTPAPRTRKISIRWIIISVVAMIIAIAAYRLMSGPKKTRTDDSTIPVTTVQASLGRMEVTLPALGTVTPRNTITVHTQIDGPLLRMPFKEGQLVKAGEVLAEIDPRPYQATLLQAQGQLLRDQALLANAELDLTRYQTLWKQDSVSKQQLDTQVALVKQYQGTVKLDQGQIDTATVNLSYTRILAPISGRVGLRNVDPGNIVHTSDANGLVVITQSQPITALFSLPQDQLADVLNAQRGGHTLEVTAWDRTNQQRIALGTLDSIDNQVDTTTGTFKLRALFANQDNRLFPNQFINIRLRVASITQATLLPIAAIQHGSIGTYVYVIKPDQTATLRSVKLGASDAKQSVVLSGVTAGEAVVIDGADRLKEGSLVRQIAPVRTSAPRSAP